MTNLEVIMPLSHSVALWDFRLEESELAHSCGESSQRLSSRTTDSDEKSMSSGSVENATDPRQVLKNVTEKGKEEEKKEVGEDQARSKGLQQKQ